eukprot:2915624-Amphidinium_carterae.6
MPHRFHRAVLKNAIGSPKDPSRRLEEDEFIGLPQLVEKYQSKQRADTTIQVEDVMPTPGETIQAEAATSALT